MYSGSVCYPEMFPGFSNRHCLHPELSCRKDLIFVRVAKGHHTFGSSSSSILLRAVIKSLRSGFLYPPTSDENITKSK